jgi:hypothetical protein
MTSTKAPFLRGFEKTANINCGKVQGYLKRPVAGQSKHGLKAMLKRRGIK